MSELSEKQEEILKHRNQRNIAGDELKGSYRDLKKLEETLSQLRSKEQGREQSREQLLQLQAELERKKETYNDNLKKFQRIKNKVYDSLTQNFNRGPEELIKSFNDSIPFLLFPVRIETKFMITSAGHELWVRVFPDDVAVTSHEKDLTQVEITSGTTYWTSIWDSRNKTAEEQEKMHKGAWHVLSMRHGATRAAWIRLQTKPTNWIENFSTLTELIFPDLTGKMSGWSEAPRSTVLPDRFVFTRYFNNSPMPATVGNYIPDQLIMGPDPSRLEPFFKRNDKGRIEVDPDVEWMVNFDKAVEMGMGVKISISSQEAALGFDRLIVMGIRVSTSSSTNRKLLESLIENHHYTTGFSFVPQGTPTNNTENAPSGLSSIDTANEQSFDLETGKALFEITNDHHAMSDGQRFAEALNINPQKLFFVQHSDKQDVSEAMAMNTALWYATMGGFMSDMLGQVFPDKTIENTRNFFVDHVAGRGFIPAFRVGNQPYGVLPTTAYSKWKWTRGEGNIPFLEEMKKILDQLQRRWKLMVDKMLVEAKNEKSEFANFLHVTGLQASSVEYYSRLATLDKVTKNYYHFMGGIMGAALNSFFSSKDLNYSMVGLNLVHDPEKVNLKDLTFRKGLNLPPLTGPVIDKDPGTPLSETAQLSFNYIQWMLDNTSQSVVMNEEIKDKDGNKIPVPKALLYQTLRHAYLTSIKEASHFTLKKKMPAINQIDFHETGIMNLNDATTRIAKDELANVDAAKIGLTNTKKPVANYLLDAVKLKDLSLGDIYPIELADFKNALTVLAKMPTARLERVFAEHLDLCGYRLDAWLNGIVNCRLNYLKSLRQQDFANNVGNELHNEITDGIHIGSFGWVEDLRPAQGERKTVDAQEITRIFGDAVTGTVTEDSANAGFILTPSLSHAVTAAILRNAYLTHAEKDNEDVMSVNLSSERVRNALFYMEGLRNGQDLGALLGYQLERGLHERHPGVEIDEYIYILREQFPLISGKLTKIDDPNATAETIEARNVINGYDLLEAVRGKKYPYQVTGLPVMPPNETADPVNFKKANAIATEIKRLEDSLDAIGDLSLAESMYQVVGGNYDRARGILQALTEGKNPPDFQVMNTPRSGKTITHRVAIAFDINEVTGWHTPLTPRAKANRHLNAWLKKILPDPKLIQWIVSGDAIGNSTITLDDLPLEPIDIVFMTGERLGDISSELERYIVHHFRSANNIKDEMISFFFRKDPETADDKAIVFHPEVADPGKTPLTDIFPLLKSLKKLLGKCRSLTAQDLMLPSEGQNLKIKDVKGYYDEATPALKDLKDLFDRTNASMISLGNLFTPLKNFYDTSIKPLYDVFNNDRSLPLAPAWNAHLDTLRLSLFSFVAYGIPEALPANLENSGDMKQKIDTLVGQTQIVLKLVQKKLTEAGALVTTLALPADEKKHQQIIDQKLSDYKGASQQIFGKDFTILPLFKIHNIAGLSVSITASKNLTDELQVEEWLQSVARVRPSVQQLNRAIINHDLLNKNSMSLIPVQLPFKAGDKWVGLPFGDMELVGDMASIMLQQVPSDVTALQCGLFIDEWIELIPAEKETAGITFHFNRPNAVAPQSILLAVSPEINGRWSWDDLLAIINETLDLSKLRVVEPDMIMETEYADILPTVLTSFDNSMLSLSTFFNHNVFVKQ